MEWTRLKMPFCSRRAAGQAVTGHLGSTGSGVVWQAARLGPQAGWVSARAGHGPGACAQGLSRSHARLPGCASGHSSVSGGTKRILLAFRCR